jgi:AcrR family transcriptional regulator
MAWTYAKVEESIDEYLGGADLEDPKVRKRMRMLEAATELFVKQGYRKTSVDEVAGAAGVAKGTVYLYFRTKADLLVGAIALEKKAYLANIKPVFTEALHPRERLQMWLRTALVLANEMPLISKLVGGDREMLAALAELPTEVQEQHQAFKLDFIGSFVDEAARPHGWTQSELEDRGQVIIGLSYFAGMLANEQVRGGLSIERYSELLAQMVVDGLVASGRGKASSIPPGEEQ